MPIISNTSPILNLAIIDKLFLLRKQFGEIVIPPGVFEELRTDEELPGSRIIREAVRSEWIKIQRVNDLPMIRVLQRELDRGEAEAIALALQTQAETILLDEREARRTAKLLGLKVTGLPGVILHARKDGDFMVARIGSDKMILSWHLSGMKGKEGDFVLSSQGLS